MLVSYTLVALLAVAPTVLAAPLNTEDESFQGLARRGDTHHSGQSTTLLHAEQEAEKTKKAELDKAHNEAKKRKEALEKALKEETEREHKEDQTINQHAQARLKKVHDDEARHEEELKHPKEKSRAEKKAERKQRKAAEKAAKEAARKNSSTTAIDAEKKAHDLARAKAAKEAGQTHDHSATTHPHKGKGKSRKSRQNKHRLDEEHPHHHKLTKAERKAERKARLAAFNDPDSPHYGDKKWLHSNLHHSNFYNEEEREEHSRHQKSLKSHERFEDEYDDRRTRHPHRLSKERDEEYSRESRYRDDDEVPVDHPHRKHHPRLARRDVPMFELDMLD